MTKHDIVNALVPMSKKLERAYALSLNTVQVQQTGSACDVRDLILDLQCDIRRIADQIAPDLIKGEGR